MEHVSSMMTSIRSQCYNTVWTPALCIHDTLDMFIFFLPTLFVTYLMLDSYGQPRSLIRYHSTSSMPMSCSTYGAILIYSIARSLFINTYISLYFQVYIPCTT